MPFIVEDGTAPDGANSFVAESEFEAYVEDRGLTASAGDVEAALVRATAYISGRYRSRWVGYRTNGRNQDLDWPRKSVIDGEGNAILDNEIPVELKRAVIEAALRELTQPNSLLPDDTSRRVKRQKVGPIETEYDFPDEGGSPSSFQVIDDILAPILEDGGNVSWFMRA